MITEAGLQLMLSMLIGLAISQERARMSDLLEDTDLKRETVKEPPKRWQNWWRVISTWQAAKSGKTYPTGFVGVAQGVYPSKEVAEQVAFEYKMTCALRYGQVLSEYLGAFPEGERP